MNRYKINDNDQAVGRAFPNAKSSVLLVPGVTNKNLLKNPYRTQSESVGPVGVDNRPWSITTDIRGNVFARSSELLEPNITNINLLQNPYRTKTDPIDEPRVLTAQTIKDIGSGIFPKYISEDRGINEVAYIILKGLHDDGVKLITISLLKSMITGKKITELLGKSQNQTMRALQFFDKLMSDATQLYKDNLLNDRLDELLAEYSKAIQSIYGPEILRAVPRAQVQEEIRKLGEISGVLSRMFRAQNQLEPGRLVPYETLMNLPPNPTPPIPQNTGDNEPSPPQEIKEPDNVRDINDPRTPANQVTPDPSQQVGPPPFVRPPPFAPQPDDPRQLYAAQQSFLPSFAAGLEIKGEEESMPPLEQDVPLSIPQRPTRNGILSGALSVAGSLGRAALAVARGTGQSAAYLQREQPAMFRDFPPDPYNKSIPYMPIVDALRAAPVAPAGVLNVSNRPGLTLLDNGIIRRAPLSADDNDQNVADDVARLLAARKQRDALQEEAIRELSRIGEKGNKLALNLTAVDKLDLEERLKELEEDRADFEKFKKQKSKMTKAAYLPLEKAKRDRIILQEEALKELIRLGERGNKLTPELAKIDTLELAEREQELAERRQELEERKIAFSKLPTNLPRKLRAAEEEKYEQRAAELALERAKAERARLLEEADVALGTVPRAARNALEAQRESELANLEAGNVAIAAKRRELRLKELAKFERWENQPFNSNLDYKAYADSLLQQMRAGLSPFDSDPVENYDPTRKDIFKSNSPQIQELLTEILQSRKNRTPIQIALSSEFANLVGSRNNQKYVPMYLYLINKLRTQKQGGFTREEGALPQSSNAKLNYLLAWTDTLIRLQMEDRRRPELEVMVEGRGRKSKKSSKTTKSTKNNKSLDSQILSLLKE
jgi:hypothetical protein